MRFAIALKPATSEQRLKIADAVAKFCQGNGFGLWVADSRSGYRTGNWFTICEHQEKDVHERFDDSADSRGAVASVCLPITLVGPARERATFAILDYLAQVPQFGVIACSMTTIDDVAFMHMQMTINARPQPRPEDLNELLDREPAAKDLPSLLERLLDHLWGQEPPERNVGSEASDYQLLAGPAIPLDTDSAGRRGALWVSREVEGRGAELSVPFMALHNALGDLELVHKNANRLNPNIEYLICRRVRNSVLRGKGKISFPVEIASGNFGRNDLQMGLSAFSDTIENAWRARLGQKHRVRELTVSWREYWLGHWTSPLD